MAVFELKDVVYQTLVFNNEKNAKNRKLDKIRIEDIMPNSNVFLVYNLKTKSHSPMAFSVIYDNVNFGTIHVTNASFFKKFVKDSKVKPIVKKEKVKITPDMPVGLVIKECEKISKETDKNAYGMSLAKLTRMCLTELMHGNGDKRVFISKDDEGNGYHGLVYGFETTVERIKELDWHSEVPQDGSAIILG